MTLPLTSKASQEILNRDTGSDVSADILQMQILELLNIYKQCGINSAKAYVYCDESGEPRYRDICENNLEGINREMQDLMGEADNLTRGHNIVTRVVRDQLRAWTKPGELETGTLLEELKNCFCPVDTAIEGAYKGLDSGHVEEGQPFQQRYFAPYREMWSIADRIIDPNSEPADARTRLGEDLFLTRTDLKDVDPISKLPYVDVVRASCGHHFSKAPLLAWLDADQDLSHPLSRVVKQCPQCKKPINRSQLVPDEEWEAKVKESARRAQVTQMRNAETIE